MSISGNVTDIKSHNGKEYPLFIVGKMVRSVSCRTTELGDVMDVYEYLASLRHGG